MKILIDIFAMQSESSRERGIGRYSEELTKEILSLQKSTDIDLLLNELYEDSNIKKTFGRFSVKYNKYDSISLENKTIDQRIKYGSINSYLIAKQLQCFKEYDIVHYSSIFEGLTGKSDTSENFDNIDANIVITLYDLIPLLYKKVYLANEDVKKWYYKKLQLLYQADLILSISNATKEDAVNILGIPEENIINISGAIDKKKFFKLPYIDNKQKNILKKHEINNSFILYTGGIDFRKNIGKSLEAFASLDKALLEKYQYVIVCKVSPTEKKELLDIVKKLNLPASKIIFTGFISDQDLNVLYNLATLFIFPSIYEGFGLPILEAMSCGTAVIGSNSSSIPEIIGREDCLFDPNSVISIKDKISQVLKDSQYICELEKYFYERAQQFSWVKSAKKASEAYSLLSKSIVNVHQKCKVAFFSPLPSQKSGISDYSLELLPFLSKFFDIDVFIDDYEVDSEYLNFNYNIYNYRHFNLMKDKYENIIYQFGNSSYHKYMYNIALENPGVVVLHDFYLSGLVNYIADTTNNHNFFFDTLRYSHEGEGIKAAENILCSKVTVSDIIKKFPLNKKVLDSANSIIVHSQYAKEMFKSFYQGSYNVNVVNQIIKIPSKKYLNQKEKYQKNENLDNNIIISAFGHISETKQYDFILKCMAESELFFKYKIKLFFVGKFISKAYKNKIINLIKKYQLKDVVITGFVEEDEYKKYLMLTDIALNLRVDSRGETSRALLMNFAYGLPTIVNDYATFSEYPDDVVSKTKLYSEEDFIQTLEYLIENKEKRVQIGTNAYNYVKTYHNPYKIARDYYASTFNIIQKRLDADDKIIDTVAEKIIDNGLDEHILDNEYRVISKILKKCL